MFTLLAAEKKIYIYKVNIDWTTSWLILKLTSLCINTATLYHSSKNLSNHGYKVVILAKKTSILTLTGNENDNHNLLSLHCNIQLLNDSVCPPVVCTSELAWNNLILVSVSMLWK